MIRPRFAAHAAAALVLSAMALPLAAGAASPRASVAVGSIRFYSPSSFRVANCGATGPAAGAFLDSGRVYVRITYSRWQGTHLEQGRWYRPDGALFFASPVKRHVANGPTVSCGYAELDGGSRAFAGQWTYRLVLDRRVVWTAHFSVIAPPLTGGSIGGGGISGPVSVSLTNPATGNTGTLSRPFLDRQGGEDVIPGTGLEFIVFHASIHNGSNHSTHFNGYDWHLADQNGATYNEPEEWPAKDGSDIGGAGYGNIAAGGTVTGVVVFRIPQSTSSVTVSWDDSFNFDPPHVVATYHLR